RRSRTSAAAVILRAVLERIREHSGALFLLVATTVANVLAYGYQVVQARLLKPEQYAALTALFGILILESVSSQVIQSATATLAARYRAHENDAALHAFVRRWSTRIGGGAAALGFVVFLASPLLAGALSLPAISVALLGLALFPALSFTFAVRLRPVRTRARSPWGRSCSSRRSPSGSCSSSAPPARTRSTRTRTACSSSPLGSSSRRAGWSRARTSSRRSCSCRSSSGRNIQ